MAEEVDLYLQQWLKTATNGKVTYETAVLTDRLIFACSQCGATAKCDRPENSTKIDYYIREFVNLHAHKGGHTPLIDNGSTSAKGVYKVPFKSIDPEAKTYIDNNPVKQKAIEDQMAKYKKEVDQQKAELQYKIDVLQQQAGIQKKTAEASSKVINITSGFGLNDGSWQPHPHTGMPEWVPFPNKLNWTPAEGTVPNNVSNVIFFPTPPVLYTPNPPAPPPLPKEKALKPKTGRRFR